MSIFDFFKRKRRSKNDPGIKGESVPQTKEPVSSDLVAANLRSYYCELPSAKNNPTIETKESLSAKLIPTYYEPFAKNISKATKLHGYRFQLCAQDGSDDFIILYYGELIKNTLITGTKNAPSKVIAKAVSNGEEIVIFDGVLHGYDNLSWQEHPETEKIERPLKELNLGRGKIFIENEPLPDDESDWEVDDDGNITTEHNKKIPWIEFKRNAITWLQVCFVTQNGTKKEILDEELA